MEWITQRYSLEADDLQQFKSNLKLCLNIIIVINYQYLNFKFDSIVLNFKKLRDNLITNSIP